jgi:hypothetical protein
MSEDPKEDAREFGEGVGLLQPTYVTPSDRLVYGVESG